MLLVMMTFGRKPADVESCLSSDHGYDDDDDSSDNGYLEVILKKCHSSKSLYYSITMLAIVTFTKFTFSPGPLVLQSSLASLFSYAI